MNNILNITPTDRANRWIYTLQNRQTKKVGNISVLQRLPEDVTSKKPDVYSNVIEAIDALKRVNASSNGVRIARGEKVIISLHEGDLLVLPSGIDLQLNELMIHLPDGVVEKELSLYLLD